MARDKSTALGYAGGKKTGVLRAALRPDARVVAYEDLHKEYHSHYDSLPEGSTARRVWSDPGAYATARGYDAIRIVKTDKFGQAIDLAETFVILNRTALIVEDA